MADKDVTHMVEMIGSLAKEFITVTPDNPRAMSADDLSVLLRQKGYPAIACASVPEGVSLAIERAGKGGVVCALGSLYMLGDVRLALGALK